MSVTLVYPPSFYATSFTEGEKLKDYKLYGKKMGIWPPLGVLYLAAVLEKEGIDVDVIDAFARGLSLKETVEAIKKNSPKIVGISATTLQSRGAVQLAERLKAEFGSNITIGLGGPHISADPHFIDVFPCFDFGVVGEAEITFTRLVKRVLRGERLKGIFQSELPHDLNDLPFPARHLINKHDYFEFESPLGTVLTSRGCPFRCLFCSRASISDRVRQVSPVRVVDEIERICDEYHGNFTFVDDTFTLNKKHTVALCNEILNRGLKIKWSCNTRANLLDEELLELMADAGCRVILIGVESGNERVRNEVVRKRVSDEAIKKVVRMCNKVGIEIGSYLMLGFPTETKEELEDTVNFAKRSGVDTMSIHTTTVYPGSDLFDYVLQHDGIDLNEQAWYKYARGEESLETLPLVYVPKGLTIKDLQKLRKKAYLKFYFRPGFIFKRISHDLRSWDALKIDILTALTLLRYGRTSKDVQ